MSIEPAPREQSVTPQNSSQTYWTVISWSIKAFPLHVPPYPQKTKVLPTHFLRTACLVAFWFDHGLIARSSVRHGSIDMDLHLYPYFAKVVVFIISLDFFGFALFRQGVTLEFI